MDRMWMCKTDRLRAAAGEATGSRRQWLCSAVAVGAAVMGGAAVGAATPSSDFAAKPSSKALQAPCLALTQVGSRLVAVGERGHVLLSDDGGMQWRQAAQVPTRTTLTAVCDGGAHGLFAVGHGAVLLHSADRGEHWTIRHGTAKADATDVLLSVMVDAEGRGLATGSYGFALRTTDGGQQWTPVTLIEGEEGERHLNQIVDVGEGVWLVVAEEGRVLRSVDHGEHWQLVTTPYNGSLWSAARVAPRSVVIGGMRGSVLRSTDAGLTWQLQRLAGASSLTAVVTDGSSHVVLLGLDGTLVVSDDGGAQFNRRGNGDRFNYTSGVLLRDGTLLAGSTDGPKRVVLAARH